MLSTIKVIKYLFLCLIGSKIHVKVMKILRIWLKKSCEYPPWLIILQRSGFFDSLTVVCFNGNGLF